MHRGAEAKCATQWEASIKCWTTWYRGECWVMLSPKAKPSKTHSAMYFRMKDLISKLYSNFPSWSWVSVHTTAETAASSLAERPSVGSTAAGRGNAQPHPHPSYTLNILPPHPLLYLPILSLLSLFPSPMPCVPYFTTQNHPQVCGLCLLPSSLSLIYIWRMRCVICFVWSFPSLP